MTIEAGARSHVERLHVHLPSALDDQRVTWRLRAEDAVRRAVTDAEPVMGGPIVVVRHLRLGIGTPHAATRALSDLVRGLAATGDVVRFTDAAEALAAHALDVVRGQSANAWWWEVLGWGGVPSQALRSAWTGWAHALPAAAALLPAPVLQQAMERAGPCVVGEAMEAVRSVYAVAAPSRVAAAEARTGNVMVPEGQGGHGVTGDRLGVKAAGTPAAAEELTGLLLALARDPAAARGALLAGGMAKDAPSRRGTGAATATRLRDRPARGPTPTAPATSYRPTELPSAAAADEWSDTGESVALLGEPATADAVPDKEPAQPRTRVPAPEGRGLPDEPGMPTRGAPSEAGVDSALAGAFFLVNVLVELGLPAAAGPSLAQHVGGWGSVEALLRGLAPDEVDDPVWGVFAALAARAADDLLGASMDDDAWSGPALRVPKPLQRNDFQTPQTVPIIGTGQVLGRWVTQLRPALRGWLGERLRTNPEEVGADLLRRTGRCSWTRTHVDIELSVSEATVPVRRAGLDRDPGWVPDLGRIVTFHYR